MSTAIQFVALFDLCLFGLLLIGAFIALVRDICDVKARPTQRAIVDATIGAFVEAALASSAKVEREEK